jgi:pimeloyl-ACP methyl ester carboxylesterase
MLLWHGSGGDCTLWETLVPHLTGFHLVAQDLPRHGRSPLKAFTTKDTLADADAVIAELDQGPPIIVGHSLGGYVGLRYAATRNCAGWIGLDGPFGLTYPWELDDPGLDGIGIEVGHEIRAINVASDFAALDCAAMLLLCAKSAGPMEEKTVPGRRDLAEHLAGHDARIHVGWMQTAHDMVLFDQVEETATMIREFLRQAGRISIAMPPKLDRIVPGPAVRDGGHRHEP